MKFNNGRKLGKINNVKLIEDETNIQKLNRSINLKNIKNQQEVYREIRKNTH